MQCATSHENACFLPVPGGQYLRGAQSSDPNAPGYDPDAFPEEGPPHRVRVDGFWIHKFEVAVTDYRACVQRGKCSVDELRTEGGFSTWTAKRGDNDPMPITGISWKGARTFCAYLGGRLPTEAEWEYAARGTSPRRYPWGDIPFCGVDSRTAGNNDEVIHHEATCPIARGPVPPSKLRGHSVFDVRGMAGSAWEWVEDWFAPYAPTPGFMKNPRGPKTGKRRVQRGGGWTAETPLDLRSTMRGALRPSARMNDVGFRCVWPARHESTP
jgi:formylglycine-generating enzyme required for sulfatase activity